MAYSVSRARKHLERLIKTVETGREVIITRNGKPLAKAVPYRQAARAQDRDSGRARPSN